MAPAGAVAAVRHVAVAGLAAGAVADAEVGVVAAQRHATVVGLAAAATATAPAGQVEMVVHTTIAGAVATAAAQAQAGSALAVRNVAITADAALSTALAAIGVVSTVRNAAPNGLVAGSSAQAPMGIVQAARQPTVTGAVGAASALAPAGSVAAVRNVIPVAFDAATDYLESPISGGNLSWSHTTGNDANCLIVLMACTRSTGVTEAGVTRSVTYGGVALTHLGAINRGDGDGFADAWGLLNPPTGANTISVGATGSVVSNSHWRAAALSYKNVAAIAPTVTAAGTSTTPSVTVSSATPAMVVAMVQSNASSVSSPTQTLRFNNNTAPRLHVQDAPGAESVTVAAVQSSATWWAAIGVNLGAIT